MGSDSSRSASAGPPPPRGGQDPFRSLAETTPDAILTANAADEIVYANPAAERLLGHPVSELVGRPVTMIVPESQRHQHQSAFGRYVATGEAHLVGRTVIVDALRRDGSVVPVELSLGASDAGEEVLITAVIRDISDRVRFQRNVAAQLAVATVLAAADRPDAQPAGIVRALTEALGWEVGVLWLVDEDGLRLADLWEADPARTGAFAQACRAETFGPGDGIPGQVWETAEAVWLEEATQEERFVRTEAAAASGLRTGVSLPLVSEGEVIGVIEVFTHTHRPLDEELRDMLRTVASLVSESLRRQQHAAELARSNADLEHFAQMVAHDLSEPLNTIAGFSDLVLSRESAGLSETGREYVEMIRASADRGRQMLDSVLALARFDTGPLSVEPVDCDPLIAEVLTALRSAIEEHAAAVDVADLPTVHADRSLLGQVFQNLLANAIKFRREVPPRISISAERVGPHWRFAVADNGQGIADGAEVFEMFARPGGQPQPGMGLGLAICSKIVKRHGGSIWFESRPGAGTTFFFTLRS